jgi:carboxypeptidase Q
MPHCRLCARNCWTALVAAAAVTTAARAGSQPVDPASVARIVDEGTHHSEVMTIARTLADEIGPRLTNSPGARRAEAWTQQRLRAFGLANVRKEGFEFGRGWWIERSSVRMLTPRAMQLTALPISWTPATPGPVTAPIVVAPMGSEADFARWHGRLAGRIVLISSPEAAHVPVAASRHTDEELAAMTAAQPPATPRPGNPEAALTRYYRFPRALDAFLQAEGALAYVSISRVDGKLVTSDGNRHAVGDTPPLPGFAMAAEDYRRLVRLAEGGEAPTLEVNSLVHYEDSDTRAYNIFADITGSEPTAAFVMAGAHLDSAAAGDGAADDGAGVAMVMEAARILATMPRPRRTIRFALWGGEEQGWLGNIAYMEKYLATRGRPDSGLTPDERFLTWSHAWPISLRPGWRDLSVYFNLDNGSGRIRGVYADGNVAAIPIFRAWLAPFGRMDASTVALAADEGGDHDMLQMIGVPGFQFIQDWNDYGRMHHTTMDTFDHLDPDDMRQASIILASFLWNAANMDRPFPRRPLPTPPG